jgi:hypothetical protein
MEATGSAPLICGDVGISSCGKVRVLIHYKGRQQKHSGSPLQPLAPSCKVRFLNRDDVETSVSVPREASVVNKCICSL